MWSSVFVTQRPKILHDLTYPLSPWASHTRRHVVLRPVFVTSGSSLSTTLTSVSNAFTDFWGLTYFCPSSTTTKNQQVSISLLSKIMDFFKGFNCESIYCCEEWTMIKNFELSVCRFLAMISERRIWGWDGRATGEVEYALNVINSLSINAWRIFCAYKRTITASGSTTHIIGLNYTLNWRDRNMTVY